MKNRRVMLLLIILCLTIAALLCPLAFRPLFAQDKCERFNWIGERFDYRVDSAGNWNFPGDVQDLARMTFNDFAVWKYYSIEKDRSYFIVFLSYDLTQPAGARAGQHDICVYSFKGLGMGFDDPTPQP